MIELQAPVRTATKGGTAVTPLLNRFFGLAVMLLSNEWRGISSPISFKFCRDFSIASIKHQKARISKERVPQVAQQCGNWRQSFLYDMTSKTVCRGFKSYCPCQIKTVIRQGGCFCFTKVGFEA